MPYTFNPHRHVKIWLSKESNCFLNLENQVRLVKMRCINPKDEIYFVYDQSLLSENAFLELQSFCTKYKIIPKELRQDIFPLCETEDEHHLIEIYTDEVSHLEDAGNLGVASDVLRWLKPIYKLGTYADFDVHIDTSRLPETILVEKPLLLSLGSVAFINDVESICFNNDTIAVVNTKSALSDIQKIQQHIYRYCSRQSAISVNFIKEYKSRYLTTLGQLTSHINAQMTFDKDANFKALRIIYKLIKGKTAREARKLVIDTTANNLVYSQSVLIKNGHSLESLSNEEIISLAAIRLREIPNNPYSSIHDDNELLTFWRKAWRMKILKKIVIFTSGPHALLLSLFNTMFFKKEIINHAIRPFSFFHYRLDSAFISQNNDGFNRQKETSIAKYRDTAIGKYNDLSWLEEGQNATKLREEVIRRTQLRIPHLFNEIRESMKAHIQEMQKIQEHIDCCFGLYHYRMMLPQINALKGILKLFDNDSFDVTGYIQAFQDMRCIEPSQTKALIEELAFFSQESIHYMLTDDKGKAKIPHQQA